MAEKLTERELESLFQKYMPSDEIPPGLADRVQQRVLAEVAVTLRNREQSTTSQPVGWWSRLLDRLPRLHMGTSFAMVATTAAVLIFLLLFNQDLVERINGLLDAPETGSLGEVGQVITPVPTEEGAQAPPPTATLSETVTLTPSPTVTPSDESSGATEETSAETPSATPEALSEPTGDATRPGGGPPAAATETSVETPTTDTSQPTATDDTQESGTEPDGSPTPRTTDTATDDPTDEIPNMPPANPTPTYTPPITVGTVRATMTAVTSPATATATPVPAETDAPATTPVRTVVTTPAAPTNTPRHTATATAPSPQLTPVPPTSTPTDAQSGAAPTATPTEVPTEAPTSTPTNTKIVISQPTTDPQAAPATATPPPTATPVLVAPTHTVPQPTATFTPPPTTPPTATPLPTATPTLPPTATATQVPVPAAADDAVRTNEDVPVTVNVLANDTNTPVNGTTITILTPPSSGTLVAQGGGVYLYTPASNFSGSDLAIYQVSANGLSDQGVVTFQIAPVNDAPTFTSAPNRDATEGQPYTYNITASDVDDAGLTISASGLPGWLTLSDNGNGTATLSGTPGNNAAGEYPITLTVSDDGQASDTQSFTIVVQNVNVAPVAGDDAYETPEDTALTIGPGGVLTNDSDADGNPLTVTLQNNVTNGSLTLNSDGSFVYTPNANYNGSDSFTYTVNDGSGGTATATVNITVNAVNDPPVITSTPNTEATENQAYTYNITATDADGDTLTYSVAEQPNAGWLNATGATLSGTPGSNAAGSYTVNVTVSDGELTDTQSFTLVVANVPPTAGDDAYTVPEDESLSENVLSNDSNVGGTALQITVPEDAQPQHGTITINNDGSFTYTPDPNYSGPDEFTYTVTDNQGGADSATVQITVNPVNDPPKINSAAPTSVEVGANYSYSVQASDPENTALVYTMTEGPGWLTFSENTLSGIPPVESVGDQNVVITVTDSGGTGKSVTQSFTIEVIMSQTTAPPSPLPSPETTGGD